MLLVPHNKRIDINHNLLKVEYNKTLSEAGLVDLEKTRIDDIINIVNNMNFDNNASLLTDLTAKIITMCYDYNINYNSVQTLVRKLSGDISVVQRIYSDFGENAIVNSFEKIFRNNNVIINKNLLDDYVTELNNTLVLSDVSIKPKIQVGTSTWINLDTERGLVTRTREKNTKTNGKSTYEEYLLSMCPVRIVEYYDPTLPYNKQYKTTWINNEGNPVTLPKGKPSDIVRMLNTMGVPFSKNATHDAVNASILALKKENKNSKNQQMYVVERSSVGRGFYFDNGELVVENYELKETTPETIKEGLQTLIEYSNWFTDTEKEYIGTIFKWSLFAPFGYAYKQVGKFMPWLYLQGIGKTGKTEGYARMVGWMWYSPPNQHNFKFGQGSFDTKARIGYLLNNTTFPINLNECEDVFEDKASMHEFLKTCVEELIVRHTRGSDGKIFKGLCGAVCTSNGYYQDSSSGGTRRLIRINFTKNEMKTEEHVKLFHKKYGMIENNPLLKLQNVSHAFAHSMLDEPTILKNNWQETVDTWLKEIFELCQIDEPGWLKNWVVDVDDDILEEVDNEEETIRMYIQSCINKERKNVVVISEDGAYQNSINDVTDPREYVMNVLQSNQIVGLFLNKNNEVCITQSFLNKMKKSHVIDHGLKVSQFAQNFGWEYKQQWVNGKNRKVVYLSYDYFVEWVYSDQLYN